MNRTITRAFEILNYVARTDEKGVTLKEIIESVSIPKSSAFDITQTLLNLKYLEVSKYNDKRYVLGLSTFSLGMKYSTNKTLISVCGKYANPLADELSRTTFVGVLEGTDIIYVSKYTGTNAKLATCNIGTRHESYCTALGKALLAFLEPEKQKQTLDEITFTKKTGNTITNRQDLEGQLLLARKRGYSIDDKENEVLMICFGAPVFDYTGKVIAAISFSDMRNPELSDEEVGERVKEVAMKISRELGFVGTF